MRGLTLVYARSWLVVAMIIAAAPLVLMLAASSHGDTPAPSASQNAEYELPLPPYLTPVPIVRLGGRTTSTGARVTLLSVKSPSGSRVTLRCRGGRDRGCRVSRRSRVSPNRGIVRFRAVERSLTAGVLLEIFVRKGATIGKYVFFKIRKKRAPARRDACLFPNESRPRECPE